MRSRHVEPERSDANVPFWLPRTNPQLAQLDPLTARQLESDRVARLVGVVRFRSFSERMDHLVFVNFGLGESGADPKCLAPWRIREVCRLAAHIQIGIAIVDPLDHRKHRALS